MFLFLNFLFQMVEANFWKTKVNSFVAGTMAGLKRQFPYGRNSMITVGSHIGPTDFSTLRH